MFRFPGRKVVFLLVAAPLALAGCELTPERNVFPELTYQHLDPIRLDVRDIVVEQAYSPPLVEPNVDHDFPIRPMDAAARWAQDRLVAASATRTATFVIRDAAVVEVPLEQSGGVTGALPPGSPFWPLVPAPPAEPVSPLSPALPVSPLSPLSPADPPAPGTPFWPLSPALPPAPVSPLSPFSPGAPLSPTPGAPLSPSFPVSPLAPLSP